ncbi:MAG TPA: lipoprotein-releasing ABC transporter permease subunit [Rhizomicrobium sp.]|nr:lipoprotein-releasing ABC transporter permease subunit [Rhizomicrobium sp.]
MASKTRPFAPFEWMIALRYLRPKRKEAFVSVISIISLVGIGLGVATLIIVMAVMNGFRHELQSRMLGFQGHITVRGDYGNITDYDAVAARIRALPGVVSVTPTVDGQVMATASGVSGGVQVRGLTPESLKAFTMVSKSLSDGAMEHFHGGDSVIIGSRLADQMRLVPGMKITLIAPRGNITPFGVTPRVKSYRIAGTFNVGMSEYDRLFVFMPLEEAQDYFNTGDSVNNLVVMVKDADQAGTFANAIAKVLSPTMRVSTWLDTDSTFFTALQTERAVMFLILTLIILVAALNIISGLYMLVKNKSADIAILRTMGATRGAIMRIFFVAGMSIGVLGTATGFAIGVLFCDNIESIRQFLMRMTGVSLFDPTIYFLSHMPAQMDPNDVIAVVVMSLSLSFLATLYPSWRAASLDPVEALRYE